VGTGREIFQDAVEARCHVVKSRAEPVYGCCEALFGRDDVVTTGELVRSV
jgi:hypothetical protein